MHAAKGGFGEQVTLKEAETRSGCSHPPSRELLDFWRRDSQFCSGDSQSKGREGGVEMLFQVLFWSRGAHTRSVPSEFSGLKRLSHHCGSALLHMGRSYYGQVKVRDTSLRPFGIWKVVPEKEDKAKNI